jgi:hypothetical protein
MCRQNKHKNQNLAFATKFFADMVTGYTDCKAGPKLSSGITCDVHTAMMFAVVWNGRPQLCFHPQRETSNIAN